MKKLCLLRIVRRFWIFEFIGACSFYGTHASNPGNLLETLKQNEGELTVLVTDLTDQNKQLKKDIRKLKKNLNEEKQRNQNEFNKSLSSLEETTVQIQQNSADNLKNFDSHLIRFGTGLQRLESINQNFSLCVRSLQQLKLPPPENSSLQISDNSANGQKAIPFSRTEPIVETPPSTRSSIGYSDQHVGLGSPTSPKRTSTWSPTQHSEPKLHSNSAYNVPKVLSLSNVSSLSSTPNSSSRSSTARRVARNGVSLASKSAFINKPSFNSRTTVNLKVDDVDVNAYLSRVESLNKRNGVLEQQVEDLEYKHRKSKRDFRDLQDEYQRRLDEISKLKDELSQKNAQSKKLEQQLAELYDITRPIVRDNQNLLNQLQSKSAECGKLSTEIQKLADQVKALKAKLSDYDSVNNSLKVELESAKEDIHGLNSDVKFWKNRSQALENEKARLSSQLNSSRNDRESELAASKQAIQRLTQEKDRLIAKITGLITEGKSYQDATKRIEQLECDVSQLMSENVQLKLENGQLKKQIAALRKQLDSMQDEKKKW